MLTVDEYETDIEYRGADKSPSMTTVSTAEPSAKMVFRRFVLSSCFHSAVTRQPR